METKVKNREWVKNAAIIFLAVLLILTFFSNTILNRSLPEVATQSIHSGTVTAQIRVTGAVTASQNYEVTVNQSRKVKSVMVREGQEVRTGDVLFVLTVDSEELDAAREELRQAQKNYQTALINASGSSAAQGNTAIQQAREDLAEAERERDRNYVDDEAIALAEQELDAAKAAVTAAKPAMDSAAAVLRNLGIYDTISEEMLLSAERDLRTKETAYNEAKSALKASTLIYGTYYNWIEARAEQMIKASKEYKLVPEGTQQSNYLEQMRPAYMKYVVSLIENGLLFPYDAESETNIYGSHLVPNQEEIAKYTTAYTSITEAQAAYDAAAEAYNNQNSRLPEALAAARSALAAQAAAALRQTDAENALNELKEKRAAYKTAVSNVRSSQNALESALREAQLNALELADLSEAIARAQQKVEELADGAAANEITAEVSGVIGSLGVTAGQTTTPNSPIATIEIPDMGYTMSASVPNDQARRVHTGDTASAANVYWGSRIDAVLTGIKTDPRDPQNSKLLTFDVSGDVSPGGNLTLSVGQRSAEYEFIVPNSALRSDTNGDFILVVSAKNSPLGDRYTAMRVDVTKLANDDTTTAVTGALNAGDFVITTSTAPIKNGDRVRLTDTQNSAA